MGLNEVALAQKVIPPAWSQNLPANKRFKLVLGGSAVLDMETGLVWERASKRGSMNWFQAISHCYGKTVGGRKLVETSHS